jgi:hypothetical protein
MFKGKKESAGVFARGRLLLLLTICICFTFGVPAGGCGGEDMDEDAADATMTSSSEELFNWGRKGRFVRKALPYDCTVDSTLESCPDIEN